MRILLLTGIYEELKPILGLQKFEFDYETRTHRSVAYRNIYATVTGAGMTKRKAIRKLMEKIAPDIIINAGLVGVLRIDDNLNVGDPLTLNQVVNSSDGTMYPGGIGKDTLATVPAPLFEPWEKMAVAMQHNARVCDMEASHVIQMAGQVKETSSSSVVLLCKVVGDLPEDYELYENESLVREWVRKDRIQKFLTGIKFPGGPMHLKKLMDKKEAALHALAVEVSALVKNILEQGGVSQTTRNLFIPH